MHIAEAAVVVGEQEAFGRDKFAGAAAAELHDGVFQTGLVEAEDLFGGKFAAEALHFGQALAVNGVGEPHSFVGADTHNYHHQCDE